MSTWKAAEELVDSWDQQALTAPRQRREETGGRGFRLLYAPSPAHLYYVLLDYTSSSYNRACVRAYNL